MSLQSHLIAGSSVGLQNYSKPYLSPDQSFTELENAYVWRERVRKREGLELVGRLRRFFENVSIGNSGASPWAFNLYAVKAPPVVPEANSQIDPGHVSITIQSGPPIVFTDFNKSGTITNITQAINGVVTTTDPHNLTTGDSVTITAVTGMTEVNNEVFVITVTGANTFQLNIDTSGYTAYTGAGNWAAPTAQGNGILVSPTLGNFGIINYLTGDVVLTHTAGAGVATISTFGYFPGLPVMGIWQRELSAINDEQTLFWDTKYVYEFTGSSFVEFLPTVTWNGTDSDFFWGTNFRGTLASTRLFFVTNFVNDATNPMRYTDGITWTTFVPVVSEAITGDASSRTFIFSVSNCTPTITFSTSTTKSSNFMPVHLNKASFGILLLSIIVLKSFLILPFAMAL
jgi:hypothetical protein